MRERERESNSRLSRSNSVIASEQSERGVCAKTPTHICKSTKSARQSSLRDSTRKRGIVAIHKSKIDCHEFASANSRKTRRSRSFFRNDGKHCHLKALAEASKDIRHCEGAKRPKQSIKSKIDCHENPCGFSRNDGVVDCHDLTLSSLAMTNKNADCRECCRDSRNDENTHPQTPSAKGGGFSKSKHTRFKKVDSSKVVFVLHTLKLAKSLLAVGLLAGISANIAMAACTWVDADNRNNIGYLQEIRCEGSISVGSGSDMTKIAFNTPITQTGYYRTTNYLIGNANTYSYILGASRIYAYFRNPNTAWSDRRHNVRFLNVSAQNTYFVFLNENTGGDVPVKLSMEVGAGAIVGGLTLSGQMELLSIFGSGAYLGQLQSGSNTAVATAIKTLRLGERSTINGVEQGVGNALLGSNNISIKVERLELDGISLNINSSGDSWNAKTDKEQHLSFGADSLATHNVKPRSIIINIGQGAQKGVEYKYENLILKGTEGLKDAQGNSILNGTHITAGQGVRLAKSATGFSLQADVSTSQGSSVYRALALSYMRRSVMTQNILDTMTTKTFHSDRYYEQEAQLKALRDDMSRLTKSSKRFSKLTRVKNQDSIDKVREKVAKLTLEQSSAQNLKTYNNFELIDQLDAMFIPYDGRRDNLAFVLPYSAHSYADMGSSNAIEWVGGALAGLQKNLRSSGIIGGYVGYEFVNTSTKLLGQDTKIQTNALQAGAHYFKSFAFRTKAWEGFIKGNIRGGIDLPQFSMQVAGSSVKLTSASSASKIPLMWSVGAEFRTGITFYQYKYNSYIAPEIGVSYDLLSSIDMAMKKPAQIGADELHKAISWHLPQASFSVRYYKMWGEVFRTNFKAGVRYNIFSTQRASFSIGAFDDDGTIALPLAYGNLALDFVWLIKKNHELSLGYDGLFYANKFDKGAEDRFNGITTTLNLKYAYWFGSKSGATPSKPKSQKPKKQKSPKKEKKPKEPKKKVEKDSKKEAKKESKAQKEAKKKAEAKAKSNKKETKKLPKKSK